MKKLHLLDWFCLCVVVFWIVLAVGWSYTTYNQPTEAETLTLPDPGDMTEENWHDFLYGSDHSVEANANLEVTGSVTITDADRVDIPVFLLAGSGDWVRGDTTAEWGDITTAATSLAVDLDAVADAVTLDLTDLTFDGGADMVITMQEADGVKLSDDGNYWLWGKDAIPVVKVDQEEWIKHPNDRGEITWEAQGVVEIADQEKWWDDLTIQPEAFESNEIYFSNGKDEITLTEIMELHKYIKQRKEVIVMELWSIKGILLVMVICVLTMKVVLPRLTLGTLFKWVIRLIVKPAKKVEEAMPDPKEVRARWEREKKKEGL